MRDAFDTKFRILLSEYSPTENEVLSIFRSLASKRASLCELCNSEVEVYPATSESMSYYFCNKCRIGKASLLLKVRSKKIIKSLNELDKNLGYYLRFFHQDNTQDSIHLNVHKPKELDVRSKDDVLIEFRFFKDLKIVIKDSGESVLFDKILKLYGKLQNLAKEMCNSTGESECLYFSPYSYTKFKGCTILFGGPWKSKGDKVIALKAEKTLSMIDKINDAFPSEHDHVLHMLFRMYLQKEQGVYFEFEKTKITNLTTRKSIVVNVSNLNPNDLIKKTEQCILAFDD